MAAKKPATRRMTQKNVAIIAHYLECGNGALLPDEGTTS